jgi:hypothetical protein
VLAHHVIRADMLIQLSSEHLQLNSFPKGKEPVPGLVLRFGDKLLLDIVHYSLL